MISRAIRRFAFGLVAGVGLPAIAVMTASTADAQVSISNGGVTFPDDTEQTSAVVLPMNCPHGDSLVWDTNAENWVCETDLSPPAYAIGETGPAGGKVFYITDGGLHGLEVATINQSEGITWGCSGTSTGAIATAVGSGAQNTIDILAGCAPPADSAASVAAGYMGPDGNTGDWFLPSKDELNELYLRRDDVGGIDESPYWSSSESQPTLAFLQHFGDGSAYDAGKIGGNKVRAVRAF